MGTTKKSIDVETLKNNNIFDKQIRADRNANIADLAGLTVVYLSGAKADSFLVKNISESGFAAQFKSDLNKGDEIEVEIHTKNDQLIYNGTASVAWVDGDIAGFAFIDRFLSESLLVHLEVCHVISQESQQELENSKLIPLEFRDLIFRMRRYLTKLKSRLDEQDETNVRLGGESQLAFDEALKIVFENSFIPEMQKFNIELDGELRKLDDDRMKKTVIAVFREELNDLLSLGSFTNRALHKPLGYAGDYEMMNQIYRESLEGITSFAKLMHLYGITEKSSLSVLERRKLVAEKLEKMIKESEGIKICALASGPAKEVLDIISKLDQTELDKCQFYLLDQDIEALLNAKRNIMSKLISTHKEVDIKYLQVSVKDILEGKSNIHSLRAGGMDYVYTMGLYDYLTQPVAKFLTAELCSWLKPGGRLFIGNFNPNNPTKAISELSADWRLIHRTDEEMVDLVPRHEVSDHSIDHDSQNIEVFLEITK